MKYQRLLEKRTSNRINYHSTVSTLLTCSVPNLLRLFVSDLQFLYNARISRSLSVFQYITSSDVYIFLEEILGEYYNIFHLYINPKLIQVN